MARLINASEQIAPDLEMSLGLAFPENKSDTEFALSPEGLPPTSRPQPTVSIKDVAFLSTIIGTEGRDVLIGTSGHDDIYGLGGNDDLYGGIGGDWLDGGLGDDWLTVAPTMTSFSAVQAMT